MENNILAKFNLSGSIKKNIAEKRAFSKTRVYRAIIGI